MWGDSPNNYIRLKNLKHSMHNGIFPNDITFSIKYYERWIWDLSRRMKLHQQMSDTESVKCALYMR